MFINRNNISGGVIKCKIEKVMIFCIVLRLLIVFFEVIKFCVFYIFMIVIEFKLNSVKEEEFWDG